MDIHKETLDTYCKEMAQYVGAEIETKDGIQKGEDPFGYGIRIDGKILIGARAQQWLEKDIK